MRRGQVFLSAGYSVIMDATFLHDDSRNRALSAAGKVGAPVLFVFADCPERIVKSRLRRRAIEHSFSDANFDVYRAMKSRFVKPPASSFKLQAPKSCLRLAACGFVRIYTSQPLSKSLAKIERALLRI